MNAKKLCTRAFTVLLVMLMVIGLIPMSALAVTKDDTLSASLTEAKSYIDGITINNSSNDPETVVKNFGTHFTWDNEKRENSKSYLFDWSYYNGVVFEGIEYLYEVTGDETYKDYVVEYMSSMITSNGGWATCSNNSSKVCAGYNSTHGADCYKTASLLLDAYEMTGDDRYLKMAATLYADLDSAAANSTYNLKNAGNNYRHTWASDPSPDLWLDGLYMILPFRAEYAKYIGDTEELDLIVSRMQWVSDNMYNSSKGLFYHAADSATSNSGTYWLRSIGWYAAAIVDVMDSMDGENLEAMKAQLVKLVDGMVACQNASNGMWLNNMNASQSSTNPYETSGTALVCYAIMKAVNNGWLDESYAQYAILAFNGICNEKLSGSTLTDICFKGAPGSSNSTFYDNEGKGVGPFIMFYAEVLEYYNAARRVVYTDDIIQITATGVGLTAIDAKDVYAEVESKIADVIDTEEYFVAYDVELSAFNNFTVATYTMEIADGMSTEDLVLYHLADDGTLTPISALMSAETDDTLAYLTFTYNTDGIFVYGTKKVVVEEDATLESLDITSEPEVNAYFKTEEDDNPALDITGLVVKATFSDGTVKTIEWNEFGEVEDGYALTFDMTKVGEQDVTVSYTYGDVTKSDTFKITVFDTEITHEESGITVAPSVPGITEVTVADNSEAEFVKNALSGKVTTFTSYDINLEGYTQGDSVLVTLPIPEGTVNPVVYYVPESGEAVKLDAYVFGNVISFVTDHFTTYVVGDDIGILVSGDSVVGTGNIAGETKYVLDKNGVESGEKYLIVSSSNDGYAVVLRNDGGVDGTQSVSIEDGEIASGFDNESACVWTFENNGSIWNIINSGQYLRVNGNSDMVSSSSQTINSITSLNNGGYRIYGDGYYLRYNSGWTYSSSMRTVYLFKQESTAGAAVTFEVAIGGSNTIKIGEKLELTGTVTVDGREVDLDDCTIAWTTSDGAVASVSGGTVTGVADSNNEAVYITATLSEYNNTELQEDIVISIPVYVQSKAVVESTLELVGSPVYVVCGQDPDYSDVVLVGEYDDGTEARIPYTALDFSEVDTSLPGVQKVTVTYRANPEKTFTLDLICQNDYTGLDDATTYPEYPNDGAVRIDKTSTELSFENTGIVEVELDVAGISVKGGVDVILVADISNSMAWKAGSKNVSPDEDEGETTKWQDLQVAAGAFIDTFLKPEQGSTETRNTVSFVIFGGFDKERNYSTYSGYFDATDTVFTSVNDADAAKDTINSYSITGNDTDGYTVTIDGDNAGTPQGGTNYDYAFLETGLAVKQIKADYAANNNGADYDASGREIYILFLTDGAPDHYNQLYYKSRTSGQFDYNALYRVDTDILDGNYFTAQGSVPNYNTFTQHRTNGYYMPSSGNVSNANWIDWIQSDSLYAAEQVMAMESVTSITAVGFDLANGAFSDFTFGEAILKPVLQNLDGSNACEVFTTDNSEALNEFYVNLATKIRYAGTAAQAHDTIGSKFTLQTAATAGTEGEGQGLVNLSGYGITPTIAVKAYDLYPKGTTDADGNDITGKRTGTVTTIEELTFSADGTEAYSSVIGEGVNIMTVNDDGSVVIAAKYFTYTKSAEGLEEFEWYIGNITDKEITLLFYAYLKGSLEGDTPKTTYYTNEEATIEYIDINGDYAHQTFPKPVVAWGGASTAYEFYLVNEDGQPCNRNGDVIPFANRIIITGPYYDELYLNQDEEYVSKTIAAEYVLPTGYTLYDETASYEVMTASGTHTGYLIVSDPADGLKQTTIVVSYTGDATDDTSDDSYIQSRVAFGVIYNKIPTTAEFELVSDQVVIDYGKSIIVDPAVNNETAIADVVAEGYTVELIGFSKYYEGIDLKHQYKNTTARSPFPGTYGTFTMIDDDKVEYTPHTFVSGVDSVVCVFKFTKGEDTYYMADNLHVIPATFVYYETDFAENTVEVEGIAYTNVFDYTGGWRVAPMTDSTYNAETNGNPDGPQDYKEIGTDIYGYDSTYTNDSHMSNGSSEYAEGSYDAAADKITTYTTFKFKGTGFDLLSRTGTQQGLIRVTVTDSNGNVEKTISVLNKSESNLTLYQIPVVSINDLAYDTYTVKVEVDGAYTNNTKITALDVLNRGNQFYFDAIRIYDPVDVSNASASNASAAAKLAFNAYVADGEANNEIYEVRGMLLGTGDVPEGWIETTYDDNDNEIDGVVFVDRNQSNVGLTDYSTIGPNNEVYLVGDQAIGFKLSIDPNNPPVSIHIGAKSADGSPVVLYADVDVAGVTVESFGESGIEIASSTSQYFDLMAGNTSYASADEIIVTIENYGDGVLSITDLKIGYGSQAGAVSVYSDTEVLKRLINNQEIEVEPTNYDVISAAFTTETVVRKQKATLVVETAEAVENIVVTNAGGREENIKIVSVETVNGVKVWTVTMRITATGDKTFTVTGYGADGNSGASAEATIKVTR